MNIPNACLPREDERDYRLWLDIDISKLPKSTINDDWIIQDQDEAGYPMWCVHFSSSMNDNHANWRDWISKRSKWKDWCEASPTFSPTNWDYINAWPLTMKNLAHIKWFFNIQSLAETMYWSSKWYIIHCWSNTINWWDTRRNNWVAVINKWSWHAFQIIWYDEDYVLCKNSYKAFPYFKIRKEDFDRALYPNKYVFENDTTILDNHKKNIMKDLKLDSAKLAFLLGLTNWERPNENITREEVMAMSFRVLEKFINWDVTKESIDKAREELKRLS